MEWFGVGDVLRRVFWHATAERISWVVLFPLQIYFARQQRWGVVSVCVVTSMVLLIFRGTISNMRTGARFRAIAYRQFCRDRDAEACLTGLRAGRPLKRRPLVLFLRPFSGDRRVRAKQRGTHDGYDVERLEARLITGFAGWSTMLSLAGPTHDDTGGDAYARMPVHISAEDSEFENWAGLLFHERPGEVRVHDNEWHAAFLVLASQADLIVSLPFEASMAPGDTATILELMALQASGLVERCIFVMPPEQGLSIMRPVDETDDRPGTSRTWTSRGLIVSALWERTRAKLAKHGLTLPPFADAADGATLFTLRDGTVRRVSVTAIGLSYPKHYLRALGIDIEHLRTARA